jgi:hypothetical protein
MALEYGFGLYTEDPASREFWKKKYEALSDLEKTFYAEYLPWILMHVDIGVVSKETIPHIVSRYRVAAPEMSDSIKGWCKDAGAEDFVEYLQRFTGYSVNVLTISTGEFITKQAQGLRRSMPKLSKKEAQALPAEDDVLLDEMPQEEWPLLAGKRWWSSHRGARAKFEEFFKGESGEVDSKVQQG